jgi:hypothetical protein
MKTSHTPGPIVRWKGFDAAGYFVNECTGKQAHTRTCAPDLLAALQAAVDLMVQEDFATLSLVPKLRAAIARATGESTS